MTHKYFLSPLLIVARRFRWLPRADRVEHVWRLWQFSALWVPANTTTQ